MSTIKTDTLQNVAGSKSVPMGTVVDGSAKAWVNFNGTGTVAIRASFNVSSITDNGTGDYTVNFTTPMVDASYAVGGSCGSGATAGTGFVSVRGADPTASALRISCINAGDALTDFLFANVAVFR